MQKLEKQRQHELEIKQEFERMHNEEVPRRAVEIAPTMLSQMVAIQSLRGGWRQKLGLPPVRPEPEQDSGPDSE